jgi:hypothetical protein
MKLYETKPVPATTKQTLVKRKCDLCGAESKTSAWEAEWYEVNETEIKTKIRQTEGTSYPEGGRGEEYEIDLCPACFDDLLENTAKGIKKIEKDLDDK